MDPPPTATPVTPVTTDFVDIPHANEPKFQVMKIVTVPKLIVPTFPSMEQNRRCTDIELYDLIMERKGDIFKVMNPRDRINKAITALIQDCPPSIDPAVSHFFPDTFNYPRELFCRDVANSVNQLMMKTDTKRTTGRTIEWTWTLFLQDIKRELSADTTHILVKVSTRDEADIVRSLDNYSCDNRTIKVMTISQETCYNTRTQSHKILVVTGENIYGQEQGTFLTIPELLKAIQ